MQIIQEHRNVNWAPIPNQIRVVLSDKLPPRKLISSSLVLAFMGDRLLMIDSPIRGWDIPGGHLEPEELPEDAARREVFEETTISIEHMKLLGYIHITLGGVQPGNYRYPFPESYQVIYVAEIIEGSTAKATTKLISPTEASEMPWIRTNQELYLAALRLAKDV